MTRIDKETRERSALEVLRSVEWRGWDATCPLCDEPKIMGHAPDCALDAALRATPASAGGEVPLITELYPCGCVRHARWDRCATHMQLDHYEEPGQSAPGLASDGGEVRARKAGILREEFRLYRRQVGVGLKRAPLLTAEEFDVVDAAFAALLSGSGTPPADGTPAGATLFRRRCGWCGAYEGTVDPQEPCATDEGGYIGPHQFGVLEAVVSGSGTPPREGEGDLTITPGLRFPCGCIATRERMVKTCDGHTAALRSAPSGVGEDDRILRAVEKWLHTFLVGGHGIKAVRPGVVRCTFCGQEAFQTADIEHVGIDGCPHAARAAARLRGEGGGE